MTQDKPDCQDSTPKITAIAPWFGGKRTLAPTIVEELGPHSSFWDIMCGGVAILFAKPPSSHEHINDLHGDLINLARVLRDEETAGLLYDRCLQTLYHEELFRESEAVYRGEDPPSDDTADWQRAYHFMVAAWMGRNGIAGTKRVNLTFAIRWTPGGGGGGVRWSAAADAIPAWHKRLRRVTILRRDVFKVAASIQDVQGTVIYADPPYLIESRPGGGCRYEHEFTPSQHRQLAELLGRFRKARVVVSYYDHPLLSELYPSPQWTKRMVYRNKNLHIQNRRGAEPTIAPEVLLLNGPSYASRYRPADLSGQGRLF